MDRVRILANEVLKDFRNKFGVDFKENKAALEEISVITSKELKNEIVGYITKFIKHEYLWRAVDQDGEVVDVFLQSRHEFGNGACVDSSQCNKPSDF